MEKRIGQGLFTDYSERFDVESNARRLAILSPASTRGRKTTNLGGVVSLTRLGAFPSIARASLVESDFLFI